MRIRRNRAFEMSRQSPGLGICEVRGRLCELVADRDVGSIGCDDHAEVPDTSLVEGLAFNFPAELRVERRGILASVAEQVSDTEFAEGALLEFHHEFATDALALTLGIDGHLHEFGGADLRKRGEQADDADDAGALGVLDEGDEVLESLLEAGKQAGEIVVGDADGLQEDAGAQFPRLLVQGMGAVYPPDPDH